MKSVTWNVNAERKNAAIVAKDAVSSWLTNYELYMNSEDTEKTEAISQSSLEWMPKSVWGPIKWKELHTRALCSLATDNEHEWFAAFVAGLPCPKCREHFKQFVQAQPPDFESRSKFFSWTVAAHNFVNRHNGKPEIPPDIARQMHAFKEDTT